jgi:hypothetical protein
MSWTEIFPVLTDEQVDECLSGRSAAEAERWDGWFGVDRVIPARRGTPGAPHARAHLVAATLFWKNVMSADPDLPLPTRKLLVGARRLGLVRRFSPWESYIEPILRWSPEVVAAHPEVEFRLYLAADLGFLAEEIADLGWEVHLMKSPSIRYCPGGFWRFLALEELGRMVTVIDTDRVAEAPRDIARTRMMENLDLAVWRVPGYYNAEPEAMVRYRPILGGHFGARGGLPVRSLLEAFIWHSERGTIRKTALIPGRGEIPIQFAKWPDYGFDEWFQLAAIYPRVVAGGALTFIPRDARSLLLPVDLEYAQWANPRSESVYF